MRDALYKKAISTDEDGISYVFYALPEDIDPCEYDKGYAIEAKRQELYAKLNNGEEVWFCAAVTASKAGVVLGTDYLGCCHCKSYEDFVTTEADGYLNDMIRDAGTEAREKITALSA